MAWCGVRFLLIWLFLLQNSEGYDKYKEVGGENVETAKEFTATGRIFTKGQMESSAVVLSKWAILTVGHTFPDGYDLKDSTFVFGWNAIENQTILLDKLYRPPNYKLYEDKPGDEDFVIVSLKSPIELPEYVSLPLPEMTFDWLTKPPQTINPCAFGWGSVSVNGNFPLTVKKIPITITGCPEEYKSKICSDIQEENGFTCKGDSGAPVIVNFESKLFLLGPLIAGLNGPCGPANNFSIIANISSSINFIEEVLAEIANDHFQYVPTLSSKVIGVFIGLIILTLVPLIIYICMRCRKTTESDNLDCEMERFTPEV